MKNRRGLNRHRLLEVIGDDDGSISPAQHHAIPRRNPWAGAERKAQDQRCQQNAKHGPDMLAAAAAVNAPGRRSGSHV